jgi:hypothetical protein
MIAANAPTPTRRAVIKGGGSRRSKMDGFDSGRIYLGAAPASAG